jgi:D-serine deaminase-like pyridoxal phosphate-dependent protein
MSDEELVKMARLAQRDDRMATGALYGDLADRFEQLKRENDRLRLTIDAVAKLGRIVGFLGDDEDRISAFIEACGPDLIERASTTLAELEGKK